MDNSMYVCPECKRIFKVRGNNKMVRCNKCDWVYLTDIHVGEEEWKTYTLEKRNSIINSKIKKSSLKIEPEDMPTAIDKRKETEIEIKKTPHGWGRNSFF